MGERVGWPKERQAIGGSLITTFGAFETPPGGAVVGERTAADALFWVAWGAEQIYQAERVRRDPTMLAKYMSETHPEVGGSLREVRLRYGPIVDDPACDAARTVYFGTMGLLRWVYQDSPKTSQPINWAPPFPAPGLRRMAGRQDATRRGKALKLAAGRRLSGSLSGLGCDLGAVPLVVVAGVVVFGCVSAWAAAWYGAKTEEAKAKREIESTKAVALAKANAIGDAVRASVAAGQPIDLASVAGADFAGLLKELRAQEERTSWTPWAGLGGLIVGGGLVAYAVGK